MQVVAGCLTIVLCARKDPKSWGIERDQLAERTKGALLHLKAQEKRISGRISFGYDLETDGENLAMNAKEQKTM